MANYNYPLSMPYDKINVYDQTEYEDNAVSVNVNTIPADPIAFVPFISPKGYGEDNKLVYLNGNSINKYGTPDYDKYGLSLYIARQFINGGGNVLGMRLAADDATHSNVGVYLIVKNTEVETYQYAVFNERNATIRYPKFSVPTGKKDDANEEIYETAYSTGIRLIEATEDMPAYLIISKNAKLNGFPVVTEYVRPNADGWSEYLNSTTLADLDDFGDAGFKINVAVPVYNVSGEPTGETTNKEASMVKTSKNSIIKSYMLTHSFSGTNAYTEESLKDAFLKFDPNTDLDPTKTPVDEVEKWQLGDSINFIDAIETLENDGQTIEDDFEFTKDMNYIVPLFMYYSLATGPNDFKINLEMDTTMNTTAAYYKNSNRFYRMVTKNSNAEIESKIAFTFGDYIYMNSSMNIEDVSLDNLNNIKYIAGSVDELYRALDKYYNAEAAPEDMVDVYSIDLLFGVDRNGSTIPYYRIDESNGESPAAEIKFENGSMGVFDPSVKKTDPDKWQREVIDAMIEAYDGTKSDLIFDEVRYPFRFIFQPMDDNSNSDLMTAMLALINERESTFGFGHISSKQRYIESREESAEINIDNYKFALYCESAIVRDPYTHKRRRFPSTYFNALAVARSLTGYGYGTPLAGPKFYWDGFILGTLEPRSTNPNEYIQNHQSRLNTMVEDGYGLARSVEQITSQSTISALSEINNSISLCGMCSLALKVANGKRWSDLTEDEIGEYKTDLEAAINSSMRGCYQTLDIVAERESVNGAGRNRIHCRITVSFNSLLKGVTYDFYIV